MSYDKNFLGRNGFLWFNGVVEDRQDPQKAGRIRVRCLGYHTDNKLELPTEDLPWASVMLPTNSPGISGLGGHTFLVEGSWVFGYFADGQDCQMPVIMGSLPGRPIEYGNPVKGFYDPNERTVDDREISVYPRNINEPDLNRLSVNNTDLVAVSLQARRDARRQNMATADFDATTGADGSSITASDGTTWNEPEVPYNTVYPYNHVYESESGHILEFDDTEDAERVHLRHRTGSALEYHPSGEVVALNKSHHYNITEGNWQQQIDGNRELTVNGHYKLRINSDGQSNNHYDIQIGPNANINIQVDTGKINLVTKQGDINVNSGGNYNVKVGGNYTMTVAGNREISVNGTTNDTTNGAVQHRGKTIDLN
jgi:hypothetical protein